MWELWKIKGNMKKKVGNDRLIGLDVFRIMAAFVIFMFHSVLHMGCSYGIFSGFVNMGAIFMTGFFMLSGFSLFIKWKDEWLSDIVAIKKFYKRRFISIYPLYWFASPSMQLIYMGIAGLVLVPTEILGLQSTFISLAGYIHNSNTWFISCLVICYLLYPFGQECVKQLSMKGKFILLAISACIILYAPFVVIFFQTEDIYRNPFYRCLEFLIGIILASACENIDKGKFHFFFTWKCFFGELFMLIVGVSICFNMQIGMHDYMLYNWIALPLFMCMIITLSGVTSEKISKSVTIRYLSAISYCFYLAQSWIWDLTIKIMNYLNVDSNMMRICTSLSLCILLSVLLHEAFEKPVSNFLRKRWKV